MRGEYLSYAWRIHELCVENVRKRDIRRHDKRETM